MAVNDLCYAKAGSPGSLAYKTGNGSLIYKHLTGNVSFWGHTEYRKSATYDEYGIQTRAEIESSLQTSFAAATWETNTYDNLWWAGSYWYVDEEEVVSWGWLSALDRRFDTSSYSGRTADRISVCVYRPAFAATTLRIGLIPSNSSTPDSSVDWIDSWTTSVDVTSDIADDPDPWIYLDIDGDIVLDDYMHVVCHVVDAVLPTAPYPSTNQIRQGRERISGSWYTRIIARLA